MIYAYLNKIKYLNKFKELFFMRSFSIIFSYMINVETLPHVL
jgi:hypothetical protein